MENSLISIIVPVYNTKQYMERCINSLCNQTYKNLEIILVNDGSTDDSGAFCDELAKRDERIRVYHKENGTLGGKGGVIWKKSRHSIPIFPAGNMYPTENPGYSGTGCMFTAVMTGLAAAIFA